MHTYFPFEIAYLAEILKKKKKKKIADSVKF